uniref:hypothetical protein n=1 Tax=Alloprevotella sp. TaxID=1872471 RepID=UPI003FF07A69
MKQIEVAKRQICKEILRLLTTTLILIGQGFARNEDSSTPNVNVFKNAAKLNKYSIKYYILNIILYLSGKIEKNEVEQNKNSLGR